MLGKKKSSTLAIEMWNLLNSILGKNVKNIEFNVSNRNVKNNELNVGKKHEIYGTQR